MVSGIIGVVFLLAGWLQFRFPPKKINHLYGYRTRASMKDNESWQIAQQYAAVQMMRSSVILLLFSLLTLWLKFDIIYEVVIAIVLVVRLLLKTERAISNQP